MSVSEHKDVFSKKVARVDIFGWQVAVVDDIIVFFVDSHQKSFSNLS